MFARSIARSVRFATKSSARQQRLFSTAGVRTSKSFALAPVALATAGLTWYSFATPVLNDTKEDSAEITSVPKEPTESPLAEASEGAEGESSQSAAYNPETGEINWDCPCLGGMADGPCGEEFKAAFSCFVYSEADPKGYDCIDKFKAMQDCFRKYPEVYSEELRDEEELPIEEKPSAVDAPVEAVVESTQEAVDVVKETVETAAETLPEVVDSVSETVEKVEEVVTKVN